MKLPVFMRAKDSVFSLRSEKKPIKEGETRFCKKNRTVFAPPPPQGDSSRRGEGRAEGRVAVGNLAGGRGG